MNDDRYGPEVPGWLEPLSRAPLIIKEDTPDETIERELAERLSAVFESRKMEPNAEGWRELALELLIAQKAPISIIAPVDLIQGGPDGSAMANFILRTEAAKIKNERNLASNAAVAKILAKRPSETRSVGTIKNILIKKKTRDGADPTKSDLWSRADRRLAYEWRVLKILRRVAANLENVTN